jgi:outer membrane protein OmpU
MRKILLATASASVLCTFAMQAQAQMTVSLGGYTEFFAGLFNDQLGPNRNKREFELESEIVVKADGKADNGLLYGVKIELQNSTPNPGTGVGTDEASIYVGGQWGRFELGDFDGAADTLKIYAPVVGVEQIDGDYTDFAGGQPNFGMHIPNSGDSTKIMYLTPRILGFQDGASYTPEFGDEAQRVVPLKNSSTYKDVGEFGLNYTGEFSGFGVAVGATLSTADGTTTGAVKDFTAWNLGAQITYGAFAFGGGCASAWKSRPVSGVIGVQNPTTS